MKRREVLNDRSIALVVWRRLRRRKIFVHRVVVRLITRTSLDILTEQFPSHMREFLTEYRAGRHERRHRWLPVEDAIAAVYTKVAMRDRGPRYRRQMETLDRQLREWKRRAEHAEKRLNNVKLTDVERVALRDLARKYGRDEDISGPLDRLLTQTRDER